MNTNLKDKGLIAKILDADTTDLEMDRALVDGHDDVEALLEEARDAKAGGNFAPLEPLHDFLRRARERFKST